MTSGKYKRTEEIRKKISLKLKGKKLSEEHRKRISLGHKGINTWMKGKHLSEETRRKISLNNSKHNLGKKMSEEQKKKISETLKENARTNSNYGMKGKHHSNETKRKISESHKGNTNCLGHHQTEEHKRKVKENFIFNPNMGMKGKKHSEETKKKMGLSNSIAQKGKKLTEETKRKIGIASSGRWGGMNGKHQNESSKKLISEAVKKRWKDKDYRNNSINKMKGRKLSIITKEKLRISHMREKNPQWKGGITSKPYSVDWNKTLKRAIRERDRYTCKICGREGLQVHHIDYNKNNCNVDNLITLCVNCHPKTNKNREKWIEYFKNTMGGLI